MRCMVSTRLDNSTERFDAVNATLNSTSTAMRRAAEEKQSVPGEVVAAVELVSVAVAIVTNSAVLAVLVRARHQLRSSTSARWISTPQCREWARSP